MVGIALFMGGETTPSRAIVQSAGCAYRLPGQRLKDEFHRHGAMQILLLRYTQALITQMAQTAVCNRHHSVDQQLCRWLLLSLDRLPSNQLTMTQELIANMLGVRREGVTEAAGKLQKLGVIRYSRGPDHGAGRRSWRQLSCECYAVVKKETDRLLPSLRAELDRSAQRPGAGCGQSPPRATSGGNSKSADCIASPIIATMPTHGHSHERLRGISRHAVGGIHVRDHGRIDEAAVAELWPVRAVMPAMCMTSIGFLLLPIAWSGCVAVLAAGESALLHVLRALLGIVMLSSFVYAVHRLSMAETYSLFLCAPLS